MFSFCFPALSQYQFFLGLLMSVVKDVPLLVVKIVY